MKLVKCAAIATTVLALSTAASAGEVTGPPGTSGPSDPFTSISNGNSFCSFSGLNDTPEGEGQLGDPDYDPGGQVQSYGYFMATADLFDPSEAEGRDGFAFPGVGCNPERSIGLHDL